MNYPDLGVKAVEKPNYWARRIGVLTIGLLASLGVVKVGQMAESQVHNIAERQHQVDEMGKFDHPLGSDRFSVEGIKEALIKEGVDPSKVTFHVVGPSEPNPTKVAKDLQAKDTWAVATEIAGESNGDHSMQTGEVVAVPSDGLSSSRQ